jgi:hypothetical protein
MPHISAADGCLELAAPTTEVWIDGEGLTLTGNATHTRHQPV